MYIDYIAYFEGLAQRHPALVHDDAIGSRSFAVVSLDEAVGDFRAGVGDRDMYMHLVVPSMSSDEVSADYVRVLGGFIIGKRVALRDDAAADRAAAWDACTVVALDMLKRMVYDSSVGHELFKYSVTSLTSLDFSLVTRSWSGDGSYHAVLCTFAWSLPIDGGCFGVEPTVWL